MDLILSAVSWAWSHPIDVAAWVLLLWAVAVVVGAAGLWIVMLRSERAKERDRLNRIMGACSESRPPCAPGSPHRRVG